MHKQTGGDDQSPPIPQTEPVNRQGQYNSERTGMQLETIKPKSVHEKDAIKALKSATNDYCQHHFNRLFAFGGDMMAEVDGKVWDDVNEALQNVEVDEFGRDANGLDIDAAHDALEMIHMAQE